MLALLDDAEAKAGNDALLEHGWHLLFGQPAVLQVTLTLALALAVALSLGLAQALALALT